MMEDRLINIKSQPMGLWHNYDRLNYYLVHIWIYDIDIKWLGTIWIWFSFLINKDVKNNLGY